MTDLDYAIYIIVSLAGGVLAIVFIWLGVKLYEETQEKEKRNGGN